MRMRHLPGIVACAVLCFFAAPVSAPAETVSAARAIEEALANNPGVKSHTERIAALRSRRWENILPDNPEIFSEFEGIPYGSPPDRYGERKVGFAQEFAFPTRYLLDARLTDLQVTAEKALLAYRKLHVRAEVVKAYYRALMYAEQQSLQQEIVDIAANIHRKALLRVDAGETTRYEPLRARVDLGEAKNRLLEITNSFEYSLYRLKQLMGRPKESPVFVEGTMEAPAVTVSLDSLKEQAMAHHPRLINKLALVEQRKVEKQAAVHESLPDISVRYFGHKQREGDTSYSWGGEIGLSLPLWDIVKAKGRIAAAEHELQAEGWDIETVKREVLLAIEETGRNLEVTHDKVRTYNADILDRVRELVRIAERSYEEGEIGYLEVIEALRTLQRTRTSHLKTMYEYRAALVDLETAAGTVLNVISDSTTEK